MRKRELLKRIEELEKSVAMLQQKIANIENRPIAPIWISPWLKENPPYTYPQITCDDDSTNNYTVAVN
jgi:hypothetical protein